MDANAKALVDCALASEGSASARLDELDARVDHLIARLDDIAAVSASARREDNKAVPAVAAVIGGLDDGESQLLLQAIAAAMTMRRAHLENIANVDTPGFKRRVVTVGSTVLEDGTLVPAGATTNRVFSSGVLEITERALDLAIDGEGFFACVLPDGTQGYFRAGSLLINAESELTSAKGNVVLPEISLPRDLLEIAIDPEGRVSGRTAGNPDHSTQFGQLTLHRFVNPSGLRPQRDNILSQTDASGSPTSSTPGLNGLGLLRQGSLERSNVQLADELVGLTAVNRQIRTLRRLLASHGLLTP